MSEPRAITLTTRATVAVALFAAVMLALLAGQFVFIVDQRQIIAQQRDIATRQERRAAPVLDTTRALIGSPKDARSAAREAAGALGELRGVLETTRRSHVIGVTAEVLGSIRDTGLVRGTGRFLQAALGQDLVGTVTRALRRTPELLDDARHAVAVLDRTYPTLRASLHVQRSTHGLQAEAVRLNRASLSIQRQTLALTQQLRDIARQTLVHAESLDRKTGGTAPPVVP